MIIIWLLLSLWIDDATYRLEENPLGYLFIATSFLVGLAVFVVYALIHYVVRGGNKESPPDSTGTVHSGNRKYWLILFGIILVNLACPFIILAME